MSVSELIVGQVVAELDQMRDLYVERAPRRVLEIGVYYGGTLREWLVNAAPDATVVAVDPQHRNPELYEGWRHGNTDLIVIDARAEDSHDEIEQHGPYDWVFIDGDHTDAAVLHDVSLCLPLVAPGGLMLIHDIAYDTETPPRVEFDALTRDGHKTWEIIEEPGPDYPSNCAHGIGVVQL